MICRLYRPTSFNVCVVPPLCSLYKVIYQDKFTQYQTMSIKVQGKDDFAIIKSLYKLPQLQITRMNIMSFVEQF